RGVEVARVHAGAIAGLDADLRAALAEASDGALVGDANLRIVLWNQAATSITGYTASEVLGRACCALFAGRDDGSPASCNVMPVATPAEAPLRTFDVSTTTKVGHPLWLHLTVFPVRVRPDTAFLVHLCHDVPTPRRLVAWVFERQADPGHWRAGGARDHGPLTGREREVLHLMAQGLTTAALGNQLHISRATARNHVQNILAKLAAPNRSQAVACASRHGLL